MSNNHGNTSPSRVPSPVNSSPSAASSSGHTGPGHSSQQSGGRWPPQSGRINQPGNNNRITKNNEDNANHTLQEGNTNNEHRGKRIMEENIIGTEVLRQGHQSAEFQATIRKMARTNRHQRSSDWNRVREPLKAEEEASRQYNMVVAQRYQDILFRNYHRFGLLQIPKQLPF